MHIIEKETSHSTKALKEIVERKVEQKFRYMDVYNSQSKARKVLFGYPSEDANNLVNMAIHIQERVPGFTFDVTVNSDDKSLKTLLLITPRMYDQFQRHGDIMIVDTTFDTNRFRVSLLVIMGVDSEYKNTIFALALSDSEKEENMTYILQTFAEKMVKQPQVVFSDQALSLTNAIEVIFNQARHFLCSWHIQLNMKKHMSSLLIKRQSILNISHIYLIISSRRYHIALG